MKFHKFTADGSPSDATHRVTVTYDDLNTTAATSLVSQLLPQTAGTNLPLGTTVEVTHIKITTAFVGTAISALTIKVGDVSVDNRYVTTAVGDLLTANTRAIPRSVTTQPYALTAADTVKATFTATGANLTALTAGQVDIFFKILLPQDLEAWA
jgi:hypothetical protein